MSYQSGTNHVEININKTAYQVFALLNSGGVIAIFPECSFSFFTLIEFLGGSPGNKLKTSGDDIRPAINYQQMDMIRGNRA
jgi:hypothetical protein